MNSVKIEKGAILALKKIIYLHGKMNELLKEADALLKEFKAKNGGWL